MRARQSTGEAWTQRHCLLLLPIANPGLPEGEGGQRRPPKMWAFLSLSYPGTWGRNQAVATQAAWRWRVKTAREEIEDDATEKKMWNCPWRFYICEQVQFHDWSSFSTIRAGVCVWFMLNIKIETNLAQSSYRRNGLECKSLNERSWREEASRSCASAPVHWGHTDADTELKRRNQTKTSLCLFTFSKLDTFLPEQIRCILSRKRLLANWHFHPSLKRPGDRLMMVITHLYYESRFTDIFQILALLPITPNTHFQSTIEISLLT